MMLAWMDLEMTGLDPSRHVIVEIATLLTDDDLRVIAEGPDIVCQCADKDLALMDDTVRSMHTRSGLLAAIRASTVSLHEAGRQTLEFLQSHIKAAGEVPLWYPEVLVRAPAKAETHRALEDIRESVAELAYYRSTIFAASDHG